MKKHLKYLIMIIVMSFFLTAGITVDCGGGSSTAPNYPGGVAPPTRNALQSVQDAIVVTQPSTPPRLTKEGVLEVISTFSLEVGEVEFTDYVIDKSTPTVWFGSEKLTAYDFIALHVYGKVEIEVDFSEIAKSVTEQNGIIYVSIPQAQLTDVVMYEQTYAERDTSPWSFRDETLETATRNAAIFIMRDYVAKSTDLAEYEQGAQEALQALFNAVGADHVHVLKPAS